MGILSGKDILSSKWITAIITDSANVLHFLPIKYMVGEYFLANIDNQFYCFKIDGTRIKTWRKTLAKSFRVIFYDTTHYLPINAPMLTELKMVLDKNNLPRIDGNLFTVLKLAGHKEKEGKDFEAVDLVKLIDTIGGEGNKYSEAVENIKNFLTHLDTDKIVTPVRKITEFLEDDLMASDPQFFGTIVKSNLATEDELRKVTNTVIGSKGPLLKIILIIMVVGLGAFIVWFLYDTGTLEDFGLESMFGSLSGGPGEEERILKKYPSPELLEAAIQSGEEDYDDLPLEVRKLVDQHRKDSGGVTAIPAPTP